MKKTVWLFLCAGLVLLGGVSVAYYNTETMGFDDSATVFSHDAEKLTFLDRHLYYADVEDFLEKTAAYLPARPFTIKPTDFRRDAAG